MWEVYPVAGTAALFTPSLVRALSWLLFRGGFGAFFGTIYFCREFCGFFFSFFFLDSPLVSQTGLRLDCFHFDEAVDRRGSFHLLLTNSPPLLSASVFPFPLCLFGALFFSTRTRSPSACSILNAMRPPLRLRIYDIPKTLNTVGFCLSWWRELERGSVRIYLCFFYKLPI